MAIITLRGKRTYLLAGGLALSLGLAACNEPSTAEKPRDGNAATQALPGEAAQHDGGTITQENVNTPTQADQHVGGTSVNTTAPSSEPKILVSIAPAAQPYVPTASGENYLHQDDNPIKLTADQPVSTFSADVDTASYTNTRRFLSGGQWPVTDAVRVEELINYFSYNYEAPKEGSRPFNFTADLARTPWNEKSYLMRVAVKAKDLAAAQRPASNLVLLVDVSGSMDEPDKLPLLISAMKLLIENLDQRDHVSIVTYAGNTGVELDGASGADKTEIRAALDSLAAGGSTNGEGGIVTAYDIARKHFVEGGVNRVILATDGDFNVGLSDTESLKALIKEKRKGGIALTTLGFGEGNLNDGLMEQLADNGNGQYFYIDNLQEAQRVLSRELTATLVTVAKDFKLQVEFNPAVVVAYRLIGYENRILAREDFNNDAVDAGDIGAGHQVTALYEIYPVGSKDPLVDPLRYGQNPPAANGDKTELAFLKIRYKDNKPNAKSKLISMPIATAKMANAKPLKGEFAFAAAVAGFGQILRGNQQIGAFGMDDVQQLASANLGADPDGRRKEFLSLIEIAQALRP